MARRATLSRRILRVALHLELGGRGVDLAELVVPEVDLGDAKVSPLGGAAGRGAGSEGYVEVAPEDDAAAWPPAFVGQASTGSFAWSRRRSAALSAYLRTDLAQRRCADVRLAVAEGFEPSKALALHAFEVWGQRRIGNHRRSLEPSTWPCDPHVNLGGRGRMRLPMRLSHLAAQPSATATWGSARPGDDAPLSKGSATFSMVFGWKGRSTLVTSGVTSDACCRKESLRYQDSI